MPESKSGALPLGDIPMVASPQSDTHGIIPRIFLFCNSIFRPLWDFYPSKNGFLVKQQADPGHHIFAVLKFDPHVFQCRDDVDAVAFHAGVHFFGEAAGLLLPRILLCKMIIVM